MAITQRRSAAIIPGAELYGEGVRPLAFVINEDFYYSRGVITVPPGEQVEPGDFVAADGTLATTPADIIGVFGYWTDTETGGTPPNGPRDATIIVRHAELKDQLLLYRGMDMTDVGLRLRELGLIVRAAVLPSQVQMGFGTPGEGIAPVAGATFVGIPNTDRQADPPVRREGDQHDPA
jgi:hypothetical protein